MVKITFDNSSFYFKNPIKLSDSFENSVSDTWNGASYIVQSLIYDGYVLEDYIRDEEFKEFQKINNATTIYIQYGDVVFKSNNNLIELSYERSINNFKKFTLRFGNLLEKKINNIVNQMPVVSDFKIFSIDDYFRKKIDLTIQPLPFVGFQKNEVNNFKNLINDYTKITEKVFVRMYFEYFYNFPTYKEFIYLLSAVKPTQNYIKIENFFSKFTQFKYTEELIGTNLIRLDLELFLSNPQINKEY